ncbi:MAG: hypothetical protein NTX25_15455 [Proteobacteria bacterium]|nr:hypothetical protein [Pseudomonadota bacterium]
MDENQSKSKDNLIDLATKRKDMLGRSTLLRGKKLAKTHKNNEKQNKPGTIRWYHYLQLIVFLALVAWLMKSCGA